MLVEVIPKAGACAGSSFNGMVFLLESSSVLLHRGGGGAYTRATCLCLSTACGAAAVHPGGRDFLE